jgi:P27 family predicted phage terminase small subunit
MRYLILNLVSPMTLRARKFTPIRMNSVFHHPLERPHAVQFRAYLSHQSGAMSNAEGRRECSGKVRCKSSDPKRNSFDLPLASACGEPRWPPRAFFQHALCGRQPFWRIAIPTPRKSLIEHELTGTKPHYDVGPVTSHISAGRPKPPSFLSKAARRKFKQLARLLENRRVATTGDAELLTLYVVSWTRWLDAIEHLKNEGTFVHVQKLTKKGEAIQVEIKNPYLEIATKAERQMSSMLVALGLTVVARDKAKQAKPAEEEVSGPATYEEWEKRQGFSIIKPVQQPAAADMESGTEEKEDDAKLV